ncbi:MAG: helix-turn-helix domain-containing protein [Acidobacteria bacterium]|nr:helix-turn-helix domain-containing protein [Acidobacteriota bacterium]
MDEPVNIDAPQLGDSLGAELRKQREIRHVTLKEIADATKISKRYLEALEQDDYSGLPAPVFTRGFVREYARYLGLNAEEMAARYSQLVGAQPETSSTPVLPQTEKKAEGLPFVRIDRNIVGFAALLVVFGAVMWWLGGRADQRRRAATPQVTATAVAPAVAPVVVTEPVVSATAPAESSDRLELDVKVIEDTWVILQVDGQPALNQVLRAGETRKLEAENEIRFEVVGNAGGLELTLNGHRVPAMGPRGKVVRGFGLDWEALKRLEGGTTP